MNKPIIAYHYKQMSYREVALYNHLFQKDPGLTFWLGSDSYAVHFEPDDSADPLQAPLTAHVRMDDRIAFELCPEEALLAMMLTDIVSVEDFMTLPEDLRGIALESVFERVLDRIDQLSGTGSTIERMSGNHNPGKTRLKIFFSLTRKKDACRAKGYIRTDAPGMQWIAARMARLTAKTRHRLHHLPVTGCIEIADVVLTRAEFKSLEPNDIVLAEGTGAWQDREVRIGFNQGPAFIGNMVESDRILIQEIVTSNVPRDKMTKTNESITPSANPPVNDIPVKLVFEIGRTDIAMGRLTHLQPGYTIQLDESIDIYKPVTIKANGVAVGMGEIVLIEEHLGIRILEFNKELRSI